MFHVKHGQDLRFLLTSSKSPVGASPSTNRHKRAYLSVLLISTFSIT